jgi:hypothetical protein
MVLGFSSGAVACHLKGEKCHSSGIIWLYAVDLERVE